MKKTKRNTNMLFWGRYFALAMTIIIIAISVLFLKNTNDNALRHEGDVGPKNLSENVTNFYAQYRLSSRHPREENIGDFVMEVKTSDKPLGERLQKMESLQKPVSGSWSGEHKHRSFVAGSTLRGAITDYAQSEGMQLIWELDKDFIVKYQFQMDNSIAGSLQSIARTIDSNFDGTVRAYVCPKQRSLVITAKYSAYLRENCQEVGT
jgi:hypothetical protein